MFDIIFKNNHIDLCKEILERDIFKIGSRGETWTSYIPQPEMKTLLDSYNIKVNLCGEIPSFDFWTKFSQLKSDEHLYSYRGIIRDTLLADVDMEQRMNMLKGIPKCVEDFYILIYVAYFAEGITNARNYFPDKF